MQSAARALAAGELVLVAGTDGSGATLGAAATLICAAGLASVYELGGDLAVLAISADDATRLGLAELPQVTRPRNGIVPASSIDAVDGLADAWSPAGRAHTIRVASDRVLRRRTGLSGSRAVARSCARARARRPRWRLSSRGPLGAHPRWCSARRSIVTAGTCR